jgi:oxygen-independent coproporphyrinogen-3 oxidase
LNLYVHFPFCRRKCTYCALHSRAGSTADERARHVASLVRGLDGGLALKTVYFGGGSPALCDLKPLFAALRPLLEPSCEFTVELHPLDVTPETLQTLKAGGVNRISMGVQSLDDATLCRMGRGHTAEEAEKAFALVREHFDNAGIDLILGYPGDPCDMKSMERLAGWGLRHCSVYSLILEERSILARQAQKLNFPDDDEVLDKIRLVSRFLKSIGLNRYEISNYAAPGRECRHNLAVWRGEDYIGLGDGAHGRVGLTRTAGGESETVSPEEDEKERRIFRLRTSEGLDASGHPEWLERLDAFAAEGLLVRNGSTYVLTERGSEVCDSMLAELV